MSVVKLLIIVLRKYGTTYAYAYYVFILEVLVFPVLFNILHV